LTDNLSRNFWICSIHLVYHWSYFIYQKRIFEIFLLLTQCEFYYMKQAGI